MNLPISYPHLKDVKPVYRDFRAGDVRHSLADISKAATCLDYPTASRPSLRAAKRRGNPEVPVIARRHSRRGNPANYGALHETVDGALPAHLVVIS